MNNKHTKCNASLCFNAGVNLKELEWGQAKVVVVVLQHRHLRFSDLCILRMLMGRSTHADLATLLVFTKTIWRSAQ